MYAAQLKAAQTSGAKLVAADCGAGVGRVSENLLLHTFDEVDLIEPSQHLLATAQQRLSSSGRKQNEEPWPADHVARNFWQLGLQQWTPEAGRWACNVLALAAVWLHSAAWLPGQTFGL